MAFPLRLKNVGQARGHLSPFEVHTPNGVVIYVVSADDQTGINILRSTDLGESFLTVNPIFSANRARPLSAWAVVIGDIIHIAAFSDSGELIHRYTYNAFNTTTNRWVVLDQVIEIIIGAINPWISIAARSDGSVVAVYEGNSIQGFRRSFMSVRSVDNEWSTPVSVGEDLTVTTDYFNPCCVKSAANDQVHVVVGEASISQQSIGDGRGQDGASFSTIRFPSNIQSPEKVPNGHVPSSGASQTNNLGWSNAVAYFGPNDPIDPDDVLDVGQTTPDVGKVDYMMRWCHSSTSERGFLKLTGEAAPFNNRVVVLFDTSSPTQHTVSQFGNENFEPDHVNEAVVASLARDAGNGAIYAVWASDQEVFMGTSGTGGVGVWTEPFALQPKKDTKFIETLNATVLDLCGKTVLAYTYSTGRKLFFNSITLRELAPGVLPVCPSGIPSEEGFGIPSLVDAIAPQGITSDEVFGNVKVNGIFIVTGIPSEESFGNPIVVVKPISPTGIAGAEAFGTATTVVAQIIPITPAGIASAEAVPEPNVGLQGLAAVISIPSDEAFGTPLVFITNTLLPTGIPSGEIIPDVSLQVILEGLIIVPSIQSAESFGGLTIKRILQQDIIVSGIPSEEGVTVPLVNDGSGLRENIWANFDDE